MLIVISTVRILTPKKKKKKTRKDKLDKLAKKNAKRAAGPALSAEPQRNLKP